MLKRWVGLIYNSFVWGLLAAVLAFQNTWLEMRINMGYIIPLAMLGIMVLAGITGFIAGKNIILDKMDFGFSAANLGICIITAVLILGFERFLVVPASIVREGIKMTSIPFSVINAALAALLVIGLAAMIPAKKRRDS